MGVISWLLVIAWTAIFVLGLYFDWQWHERGADGYAYWASLACYTAALGSVFTVIVVGGTL